MGLVKKLFKKKKPMAADPAQTSNAILTVKDTEEMLQKKYDYLQWKIEQEKASAIELSKSDKRLALRAVARKRRFEKELAQVDGSLQTLTNQRMSLEQANFNTTILNAMRDANSAMKNAHGLDRDEVFNLVDEIAENQEAAEEIGQLLSTGFGRTSLVDDEELLRELELLEMSPTEEKLNLPEAPSTSLPPIVGRKSTADSLEEQLRMLA